MLKKIPTGKVRQGMFVHKFCGSWVQHPFWRNKFLVSDAETERKILESGLNEVIIDLSRGLDVAENLTVKSPLGETDIETEGDGGGDDVGPVAVIDELRRANAVVSKGKQKVASMFTDARMGRALQMDGLVELVDDISSSMARNPYAILSVARIKTKNEYTYMHSVAVSALMIGLARVLGHDEEGCRVAGLAGLLHDIGKVTSPDEVLNKPGKLTDDEFAIMQTHPVKGFQILQAMGDVPDEVLDVCMHHHEKMNGRGYPAGLEGDRISLLARMGAICDVYDAITSNRPYKSGWDPALSLGRMSSWEGHFDTGLLQKFVSMLGIYPVGSLVKLESKRLAIVTDQSSTSLLTPKVTVFFDIETREPIAKKSLDLADSEVADRIVGREDPKDWGFEKLEKVWMPD